MNQVRIYLMVMFSLLGGVFILLPLRIAKDHTHINTVLEFCIILLAISIGQWIGYRMTRGSRD